MQRFQIDNIFLKNLPCSKKNKTKQNKNEKMISFCNFPY